MVDVFSTMCCASPLLNEVDRVNNSFHVPECWTLLLRDLKYHVYKYIEAHKGKLLTVKLTNT